MNVRMPLSSNGTGPSVGRGNDVETDARRVPRKTGSALFHRPLITPNPTTIQRFIRRYPANATRLLVVRNHHNRPVGTTTSTAPKPKALVPSGYRRFTVTRTDVTTTLR